MGILRYDKVWYGKETEGRMEEEVEGRKGRKEKEKREEGRKEYCVLVKQEERKEGKKKGRTEVKWDEKRTE